MLKQYHTPFGDFNLQRIPDIDKNLQAWNAADTYLLNHLFELYQAGTIDLEKANILIMNDDFGALTVPIAQFSCDSLSDSYISHDAIAKNIHNNCPEALAKINFIKSTAELEKNYDVVLFKDIKSQTFLKEEMLMLANHISSNTLILGAAMAKNLPKSTLQMLSKVIGNAQASLAWKKARLIHIEPEFKTKCFIKNIATYHLENGNEEVHSLANVFSRNRLDIGTRFFLQHFPSAIHPEPKTIIDLGCGNGVLALKAAQYYPDAIITCVDESYMALESAKLTIEANLKSVENKINFRATNALTDFAPNSADLILCNPPFHQQYIVGDAIAWQMFRQSKNVLGKGGEIWVVGNRHLGYHLKLKKIFGNQKLIAANSKFVILKAVKH